MAQKEKEKKKIKPLAPSPTYTPIDASLNKTYIKPRGALKSNIVVSQEDLMPAQAQARPALQVRGALAPPKPETPTKPVGTIASPIGLPSMEQQLRTATTAFKPVVPASLPSPGDILKKDTTTFKPSPNQKPVATTPYEQWYAEHITDSPLGKALTGLQGADKAVEDFKRGFADTATFGLTQPIERAAVDLLGDEKIKGMYEASKLSPATKLGEFAGYIPPGTAIERGIAKVAKPLLKGRGALTRGIVTGAATGAAEATGQELGDVAFRERTFDPGNIALGAAIGGGLPVAFAGLGKAAQSVLNKYKKPIQPTLGLPAPRQRGNLNTAGTGQTIVPEYTFKLPEASPATINRMDNVKQARDDLRVIDDEIRQLNSSYERAIVDEYNYLKQSLNERGGVQQGQLQRNAGGDVVGRTGRISNNPLWYQEFHAANGKVPSNKELYDLARQRVDNGFTDEAGDIPSWKFQNGFDENMSALQDVRTQISSSLKEFDPPINVTDSPLKSSELSFSPVSGETTSPQIQAVQAPITSRQALSTQPKVAEPAAPRTPVTGERAFFSNLEQGGLTPEVQARMSASEKRGYEQITNIETVDSANARIEKLGVDRAEAQLLGKTKFKADDVATGMRLIQELQNSRQVERAVTIAEKLAKQLTEAGQAVQAASIWNRLSPEGALLAAQRKVNSVNENLLRGQTPVKLTEDQATKITEAAQTIQASGASQERAKQVIEIMNRERSGGKITGEERKFVSDFIKDAKSFLRKTDATKPPVEATHPPELKNPVIRKRVISYLDSAEQAARERIRARGNQLSSTPLDIWADYAIIGASKMVKGALKFSVWSESMVRDFGEGVRPQLKQIYEKSKETLKAESLRISQQRITSAEKIAENWLNRNEARLLPEDITLIQNISDRISKLSGTEQRMASQEIQQVINSFEKAGIGRKASALQYIQMLLNPLTQIRNVVGNELMYRLERLQRIISTPIDIATSKLTGSKRTVTFKRGPSVFEDYFQPTKDFFEHIGEGFSAGWRGVNPEGLQSKYELMGQAFTSKYNPLTYMEKALGAVMQGFDYAAYKRATNGRLAETAYLDALNRGIKGDDAIKSHMLTIMSNMDDQIHAIASEYGKFATLQNESALATGLTTGRRIVNRISTLNHSEHYGLGSVALPFAKTPANLLMRSIDYSPLGVLKAMNQTYNILRDPLTDLTRADVIESVSRAAIGSGIGAFAYWLADKGALWGKSDKDPEVRKLMTASGQTDFQINGTAIRRMIQAGLTGGNVDAAAKKQPGDTFWSYSWAAPTATPIAIGSSVWKGVHEKEAGSNIAANAALSAANTLLDSSVLSSITEIFKQQPGSDNPFGSILMNLVKQVPSQFVPSLARQINSLADPTVKETYAMKDDLLGQITNYAESSLPYLSQQLPQRVSTLGKPQERLNTFVDVFLSPAARSKYKPTPEAQMVIDIIEETGDNKIAPRAVAKYIEGVNKVTKEKERIDLTPEEYVRLQTFVGQETEAMLKRVNDGWTTERKVEFIIDGLNAAGAKGRNMMKKEFGLKITR